MKNPCQWLVARRWHQVSRLLKCGFTVCTLFVRSPKQAFPIKEKPFALGGCAIRSICNQFRVCDARFCFNKNTNKCKKSKGLSARFSVRNTRARNQGCGDSESVGYQ